MLNVSFPPCTDVPDCAKKHNSPPKKVDLEDVYKPCIHHKAYTVSPGQRRHPRAITRPDTLPAPQKNPPSAGTKGTTPPQALKLPNRCKRAGGEYLEGLGFVLLALLTTQGHVLTRPLGKALPRHRPGHLGREQRPEPARLSRRSRLRRG